MAIREVGAGMTASQVAQMITEAASQITINMQVVEGQTIELPDTSQSMTLNIGTGGLSLEMVTVKLPGNPDGIVGQRIFVNSDGEIATVMFESEITVNNPQYMFNPGDNCVYYRNKPNVISRITS